MLLQSRHNQSFLKRKLLCDNMLVIPFGCLRFPGNKFFQVGTSKESNQPSLFSGQLLQVNQLPVQAGHVTEIGIEHQKAAFIHMLP